MLVLTRKIHQKIKIGDNVTITVVKVHGDQVSLGFEASKDIAIYREEIWREIRDANIDGVVEENPEMLKKVKESLPLVKKN